MAKVNQENKEKRNPILWFLFAIVIPLTIVSVIVFVILSLLGFNVTDWVKEKGSNVPVISSIVTSEEEGQLQDQLFEANEMIQHQKEEIEDLNREIESLERIIEDLELEITRLQTRNDREENETNQLTETDEVKQVAASFRKMEPEKAAQIIQNLDKSNAIQILSTLSGDVRGGILAEMEPKLAADLMEEMMN